MLPRPLAALVLTAVFSCASPGAVPCGEGVCPPNHLCSDALECIPTELARPCRALLEGQSCAVDRLPGTCRGGVCRAWQCGNGFLEGNEVCDDGNTAAGDGCGPSCQSNESCGNGVIDPTEECDCGRIAGAGPCGETNSNAPGASCRQDCRLATCGDGIVDPDEDCELGVVSSSCADLDFYQGRLSCTSECRFDQSECKGWCGDGIRNGLETCDGNDLAATCLDLGFDTGALTCSDSCGHQPAGCGRLGWQPALSLPGTTSALWVRGDFKLAAWGSGRVSVFENGAWQFRASEATEPLEAAWGASSDAVFLVGREGVFRYDGVETAMSLARVGMNDVWGFDDGSVIAVGDGGFIAHFDGSTWSVRHSPTAENLYGVHGSAPSSIYAVGARGTVLHFDGLGWTEVESPLRWTAAKAVWARSDREIYVGGSSGALWGYDGSEWRDLRIAFDSIESLAGTGSHVVAGDRAGVLHSAGHGFRRAIFDEVAIDEVIADGDDLWALSSVSSVAYRRSAIGSWGVAPDAPELWRITGWSPESIVAMDLSWLYRFDGLSWTRFPSSVRGLHSALEAIPGENRLVLASRDGEFAIGSDDDWERLWDGPAGIWDVWAGSSRNIVAVSFDGTIAHVDAVTGKVREHSLDARLRAVAGNRPDNVWAVGAEGAIARFDGVTWKLLDPITDVSLYGVWVSGDDHVFTVGADGVVLHFDGRQWTQQPTPTEFNIVAVLGVSSSSVFATGRSGLLLHFDGTAWSRIRTGATRYLLPAWVGPHEQVFHEDGTYMRSLFGLRSSAAPSNKAAPK